MSWFRVDDMFWEHPKVAEVSDAAAGLWAKAGSYCKYFGTDGHISKAVIRHLSTSRKVSPLVAELVASNLWEIDARSDGYVFHNWSAYQTLTEADHARRTAHARAQQTYRDKAVRAARDQSRDHDGDQSRDHDGDQSRDHDGDRPVIDHTSDHSRARVHNPDKTTSVSSSATGTSRRAPDDDDRSLDNHDDDEDGWAGRGFVSPARAQAAIVIATVRECTGLVIPAAEAEAIVADVLGGRQVRDPAGYLRRAIAAEAARDVALIRWLGGPPPPASPGCRPSAGDRAPSAASAREVLDRARHPEGRDVGRVSDPEAAHRGAARARQALADRPKPPEPEAPARPVYTPDGDPADPAAMRAAQLAAEAEPDPPPPDPPPEPAEADPPDDVPF